MAFRNPLTTLPAAGIIGLIQGSQLAADAIDGKVITGALIRTAAAGKRWQITSTPANTLDAFSGATGESSAGKIAVDWAAGEGSSGGDYSFVGITPPALGPTMADSASIVVIGKTRDSTDRGSIQYTGASHFFDGDIIAPNMGDQSFGGTPLWGSYDPAKPIHHFLARKVGTSDASGFATASAMPPGVTAVLVATTGRQLGTVAGWTVVLWSISGSAANFQLRSGASPFGALATTAYDFSHDIAYQI